MRASAASGSQSSNSIASPKWSRTLRIAFVLDRRQHLGHAVDERLAADEAGFGMGARLRGKVLAAAEANFEADVFDRVGKECAEIGGGAASSRSSGQSRQQRVQQ